MAGSRQGTGKPKRAAKRMAAHVRRVQEAATAEQQLAKAFDMARAVAYRHPQRTKVIHELATELYQRALELEGSAA